MTARTHQWWRRAPRTPAMTNRLTAVGLTVECPTCHVPSGAKCIDHGVLARHVHPERTRSALKLAPSS
jgi:hypothetical protein